MRLSNRIIGIFALILNLSFFTQAQAISVAVFPVDDLSRDHNSISTDMNKFLAAEIYKRGLEVLPYAEIFDYMTVQRIRHLGFMESHEIMKTRGKLGADLVLLASVCQQDQEVGILGITLFLVRTSDARTVWAKSIGVSLSDEQRFLGINSPITFKDLLPILADKIFVDWPVDLDFTAGRELAGEQIAAAQDSVSIQVESAFFTPKFVKPGEEVKCTIRFKSSIGVPDGAKIFVKVGNREYLASSDDGVYYKAAWFSPGGPLGEEIQVASINNDALILKSVWTGEAKDATYPVSLMLDWPSGKRDESYIGSYVVDSIAPEAILKLHGKVIDGVVSFRKQVGVSVRIKRNEPINKWEFIIADSEAKHILSQRGRGVVPDSLIWNGRNQKNLRAASGVYSIILKIWDRAGNLNEAAETVELLDSRPGADVTVEKVDSNIIATLSAKDHIPVTSWQMQLWSDDNILLTTFEGDALPAEVKLDGLSDTVDKEAIACILAIRDTLGNRSKREIPDLLANIKLDDAEVDIDIEDAAKTNDWQTDF